MKKKRFLQSMSVMIILIIGITLLIYLEVLAQARLHMNNTDDKKDIPYDVVLDAGHGGDDTGVSVGTLYEKDITLTMVKEIGTKLEEQGYHVRYTRDEDIPAWGSVGASDSVDRLHIVNESKAKLFVSIHTNETKDAKNFGFELWGKIKQPQVFTLARNVMASMQSTSLTQSRGIKDQDLAPLAILKDNPIPAIVIYCGYLMNPQDRVLLTSTDTMTKYADSIAQGIVQTLQEYEKQ